jgi:hypothetical protein
VSDAHIQFGTGVEASHLTLQFLRMP